jgi:ABC-2 type transport system ATP-binding protein
LGSSIAGETIWEARIEGNPLEIEPLIAGIRTVAAVSSKESSEENCRDYRIHPENGEDIRRELFSALSAAGYPLLGLKSLTPTLEESFLSLTGPERKPVA